MSTDTLYETDFVTWTKRQASALRQAGREGSNLPIDWDYLAEEIEDVGNEVLHKIESLTSGVLLHILKLACSPSTDPRVGWAGEIDEFRSQLLRRLADNHAIRARYGTLVEREFSQAVKKAERAFRRHGEESAMPLLGQWRARGITADEILEDGLYPVPGTLNFAREPD